MTINRDVLRIAIVAVALFIGIGPAARATIVQFGFDSALQTGPLAGTQFPGTGSYDTSGVTGIGQEFVTLTSLNFTLGVPFTKSDIFQGGQAILQDGVLSYFTAAFFPPPPNGAPVDDIAFGFGGPGVIGYLVRPTFGSGIYTLTNVIATEPLSAPIFAAALLVLIAVGRWPAIGPAHMTPFVSRARSNAKRLRRKTGR
jgi:hypothetical protein